MFNLFRKKEPPPPEQPTNVRDMLFGDVPFAGWPRTSSAETPDEPWRSFAVARELLGSGRDAESRGVLRGILAMPGLESRHYLQAWHFLRGLGESPDAATAKQLYGVVIEVALDNGLDIVAAYADGTARYFNYSGASIIWERPDASLDANVSALLEAGREVVAQIGPWEGVRPSAPPRGQVRINLLTPSGLHFGQGSFEVLSRDPMGGPPIYYATQLMQALIAKTGKG